MNTRFNQIEVEVKRHLEDASLNKSAHFYKYGIIQTYINRINKASYIAFWGLIITWFASSQIFSTLNLIGFKYNDMTRILINNVLPVFFVVVGIIATTLQFAGGFNQLSQAHWAAAMRYQRVFRRLVNWKTDCPSEEHAEMYWKELVAIRQAITDANEDSPDLDRADYEYARVQVQSGGIDYEADSK